MHVTFENLVESFEANALEGKIWLNPNAMNAGSETEVSGTQLTSHHNFHKLVLPQKRSSDVDRLSADEFLEAHAELKDKRVPPMIAARQGRAQATAEHFQKAKEATATARSGATSLTDYGQEPRGLPPYSDIEKTSLRNLAKNMSAAELQEKCESDPSFRKALDSL